MQDELQPWLVQHLQGFVLHSELLLDESLPSALVRVAAHDRLLREHLQVALHDFLHDELLRQLPELLP